MTKAPRLTGPYRVLPMLLILLLTALTFGTAEASADDELKSRIYTVAFAQDTLSNDWRRAQIKAFAERFAAHPNIRFIYSDGEGQTTKQISDIEDFIYQQVDVLITSPRDTLVSAPAIARAYATGIPVVLVTRAIDNESYTTLVAPSDYLIGHRAGSYLAKHIGERGRVLMLRGVPTTSTAQARTQGFLDAIERYPGIVLAAVRDGNYLRADAIRETEQVLSEGIAFDAIYAQSDSMASGARMALRKAGLDPKSKLIVGIDYIDEAREAIRRGEQAASFVYPTCAEEAVQAVLAILDGRTVPKHIEVSTMLVDKHNVDQVEPVF